MVLFLRRFCLSLVFLLALATGFVVASPTAFAVKECQCGCSAPGGALQPNGSGGSCTTDAECTIPYCNAECRLNGPGVTPARTTRRRYACVEVGGVAPVARPPGTGGTDTAAGSSGAAPAPAPSGSSQTPAPAPAEAPAQRRGTCSFQCVRQSSDPGVPLAGAVPVPVLSGTSCTSDGDCVMACTNRCQVAGSGETGNGIAGAAGEGLTCAASAPATCVFAQQDTTSNPSAPSSGGAIRFVLPTCTETGNCTLTDVINTAIRAANFLLALSGVVFLFTFLYAGSWLIFFAYDSSAIKKAKDMIVGASIGMIIIMVAGVAIRFVSASFGVSATTTRLPGAAAPSAFRTGTGEGSGPGGARP